MKNIVKILAIIFLVSLPLTVIAGGFAYVTSAELKAMMEEKVSAPVVIDSRPESQYEDAHIKGAISIPLSEMEQNPALPKTLKDAKLVFYCSGNT